MLGSGRAVKVVFCGTPSFAVPTLHALLAAGHSIPLVVTQPDRPSGRGMQLVAPPVKLAALDAGLAVVQPEKIKNNQEFRALLESIAPDVIVVVAYGRIIPQWMLDLPRYGNINLHGSLLPHYRGAAPIQWAVARGETVTGVTTMLLEAGLDTGDMLLTRSLPIAPSTTAEEIFPQLAELGAPLMVETLQGLAEGTLKPQPQDHAQATLAPILTREDGRIDFSRPAVEVYNRWRGFTPWPGAWTMLEGKKLSVNKMLWPVKASAGSEKKFASGSIHVAAQRIFFACGDNDLVEIQELQVEGKKRMLTADFLRGNALVSGQKVGQ